MKIHQCAVAFHGPCTPPLTLAQFDSQVVEQGSHDELMVLGGRYARLLTSRRAYR